MKVEQLQQTIQQMPTVKITHSGMQNEKINGTTSYIGKQAMIDMVDKLEQPEITEHQAWEKVAESYAPADPQELMDILTKYYVDEPEDKMAIPQFVLDEIQSCRKEGLNVYGFLSRVSNHSKELQNWSMKVDGSLSFKSLVTAWFREPDVEKEQLYVIKLSENTYGQRMYQEGKEIIGTVSGSLDVYQSATRWTQAEVEEIDNRYLPFLEPTKEIY